MLKFFISDAIPGFARASNAGLASTNDVVLLLLMSVRMTLTPLVLHILFLHLICHHNDFVMIVSIHLKRIT